MHGTFYIAPLTNIYLDLYSEITTEVMGYYNNIFKEENVQLSNSENQ